MRARAHVLGARPRGAEKADREKPINFSAEQPAEVDFEKRVGTLRGNVVITQGTMTIRADRIDFKQNADNSLSATAYGNPVSVPPEKGRLRRVFRRLRAARRLRRPEAAARALRSRAAEAGQRRDPQQLHFLQQRDRALQGRGPARRAGRRGAGRARARRVPAASRPPLAGKARRESGKDGRARPAGGATPKMRKATPAANAAPPLKLTPDRTLPAK